jgi:hypothetical protein
VLMGGTLAFSALGQSHVTRSLRRVAGAHGFGDLPFNIIRAMLFRLKGQERVQKPRRGRTPGLHFEGGKPKGIGHFKLLCSDIKFAFSNVGFSAR